MKLGTAKNMQDYLRKCIEFDVANSKISKLIKDETMLANFKFMMTKYYRHFKDAFYYLSRSNPSATGIFSISQLEFMGFLDQQKYITKRVNHAKIMLKLYACLSAGEEDSLKKVQPNKRQQEKTNKLISRPQFLEFLVRLAIEKWCSFNPNKNKKQIIDKEKQIEEEESKLINYKRNNSNVGRNLKLDKIQKNSNKIKREPTKTQMSPIMNLKNKSPPPQAKVEQASPSLPEQEEEQVSEEQEELKKCKLELPLPLIEGIERTMKTLSRYAQNYNSWTWRKLRYLKIDILIVFKAYEQFLNALFEKYTNSRYFKTSKPKKLTNLMTLDEIKTLFLDTDIRKTKQAMKQVEQAFLDSKRLSIEDGNIQYGLNFEQFQQCLARMAEVVWFNPASAPHASIWDNQLNRKNTPLFLRLESFIIALYWRSPDLHNRRMTKIVDKGIFQLQITLLMQKIDALTKSSGSLGLRRRNSIIDEGEDAITLRKVIQELREYYDSLVIRHEYEETVEETNM